MSEQTITVGRDIRAERDAAAEQFQREMTERGTLVVRLLSSPGSGKTSLLEKTAERLTLTPGPWKAADGIGGFTRVWGEGRSRVGILVGDVETTRDAERLAPYAPSVQITTGGACHLELPLVQRALPDLGRERFDYLFIEDVGNLICPASHPLGEHIRGIVLSTTEGDDKPGKYPKAFRTAQVTVITKLDLLRYVPFSVERAQQDALRVQPDLTFFPLCAPTGEGMDPWCDFLRRRRQEILANKNG